MYARPWRSFTMSRHLKEAIDELLRSGFDRAELSLVAGAETVTDELGHMYEKVADAEDDASIPRAAFCIVTFVQRGGRRACQYPVLCRCGRRRRCDCCERRRHRRRTRGRGHGRGAPADWLAGRLRPGWTNITRSICRNSLTGAGYCFGVRVWDKARELKAVHILSGHSAHDVHVHGMPDPAP